MEVDNEKSHQEGMSHEDLLEQSRRKSGRYFLEAEWGVGATISRGYICERMIPQGCYLCGENKYACLGSACMGKPMLKQSSLVNSSTKVSCLAGEVREIPGKEFKPGKSCEIAARNPGPKVSSSTASFVKEKPASPRKEKKKTCNIGHNVFTKVLVHQETSSLVSGTIAHKKKKTKKRKKCGKKVYNCCMLKLKKEELRKILLRQKKVLSNKNVSKSEIDMQKRKGVALRKKPRTIDFKHPNPSEISCNRKIKEQMMTKNQQGKKGVDTMITDPDTSHVDWHLRLDL